MSEERIEKCSNDAVSAIDELFTTIRKISGDRRLNINTLRSKIIAIGPKQERLVDLQNLMNALNEAEHVDWVRGSTTEEELDEAVRLIIDLRGKIASLLILAG